MQALRNVDAKRMASLKIRNILAKRVCVVSREEGVNDKGKAWQGKEIAWKEEEEEATRGSTKKATRSIKRMRDQG
jgi:hypothetical protein